MGLPGKISTAIMEFLKDDFHKAIVVLVLLLGIAALVLQPQAATLPQQQGANDTFYHFFYLSTCPHCHEQMNDLHPALEREFNLTIAYHEASEPGNRELFEQVCEERGLSGNVPTTFVGNKTFIGYSPRIGEEIRLAVRECQEQGCANPLSDHSSKNQEAKYLFDLPFLGKVDGRTASLPVLAVVLGLIDGFNPCAMWVLVYLISLVMTMNDKKRIFLIVGSFILASGILYFLFMTAWLNAFLLVGYLRPVSIFIGMLAFGGGVLGLREYWDTREGELNCKVGDAQEHSKLAAKAKLVATAPITISLLFSIIVLAFVVNSVEFVCSSAIPAVFTQILALQQLPTLEYYGYILLYDLFFMLDDLIIFGLAAFTISGSLGNKYARWCKLAGGAIMLLLGIMLLFLPRLLW